MLIEESSMKFLAGNRVILITRVNNNPVRQGTGIIQYSFQLPDRGISIYTVRVDQTPETRSHLSLFSEKQLYDALGALEILSVRS